MSYLLNLLKQPAHYPGTSKRRSCWGRPIDAADCRIPTPDRRPKEGSCRSPRWFSVCEQWWGRCTQQTLSLWWPGSGHRFQDPPRLWPRLKSESSSFLKRKRELPSNSKLFSGSTPFVTTRKVPGHCSWTHLAVTSYYYLGSSNGTFVLNLEFFNSKIKFVKIATSTSSKFEGESVRRK